MIGAKSVNEDGAGDRSAARQLVDHQHRYAGNAVLMKRLETAHLHPNDGLRWITPMILATETCTYRAFGRCDTAS